MRSQERDDADNRVVHRVPRTLTHSDSLVGNFCWSSDSTNQWDAINRVTCATSQDRDSPWPFNFLTLGHLRHAQLDSHLPTDMPSQRRGCHLANCIAPDNRKMMNASTTWWHLGKELPNQGFQCMVHAGAAGLLTNCTTAW